MAMTWRPPADLARRLRVVAALTGRSANEIMNEAVVGWLDHNQPPEAAALLSRSESTEERLDGTS